MSDTRRPYELLFGYQHCTGRTHYHAGWAATLDEARQWVDRRIRRDRPVAVPAADPVRWCPVHHCHMKRQRPWFGYRLPDGSVTGVRTSAPSAAVPTGMDHALTGRSASISGT